MACYRLDDILIFNKALTESEIQAIQSYPAPSTVVKNRDEEALSYAVTIFPNPASDNITARIDKNRIQEILIIDTWEEKFIPYQGLTILNFKYLRKIYPKEFI